MKFSKRFIFICGAILLPLGVILIFRHLLSPHSSDDVAVQTALDMWFRGLHHRTYLPSDNYLFKLPVYVVAALLPISPHLRLLFQVLVLTLGSFSLYLVAIKWISSVHGKDLVGIFLPTLWLTLVGASFGLYMMVANYRNLELGFSFLVLALVFLYARGKLFWKRYQIVLSGVVLSFFWFSDPYFMLLLCVPLIVFSWAWVALKTKESLLLRASLLLLASVMLSYAWHPIVNWLGINIGGSAGVSLHGLRHRIALFFPSLCNLLGISFNHSALRSLLSVSTITVLLIGLACSLYNAWLGWRDRSFSDLFIGTQWAVVSVAFLLSSYIYDPGAGRYLILIPFYLVLAISITIVRLKPSLTRTTIVAAMAVASVANLSGDVFELANSNLYPGTAAQNQLLHLLKSAPDKGYAQYWSANINSYLSNEHPEVVPIDCVNAQVEPLYWFMDDGPLLHRDKSTFYLYEDNVPQAHACPLPTITGQFGQPARILRVNAHQQLLIYPYDLVDRFPNVIR